MTTETTVPASEVEGCFAGFFRDLFGKRRMVLRVDEDEVYLKVPKPLRKELAETLVAGQRVTAIVHGLGGGLRVVSQVRIAGQSACVACPIRVCVKKNCWRNGGRELWESLEQRIAAAGLGDSIKLKAVNCLDHCKHGPNAECAGREYHRCTAHDVDKMLAHLTA